MYREVGRWSTVRKGLMTLCVGVLSLPLLFVLWLLMAVRMPRMDSVTLKLPIDIRTTVAAAVMANVPWNKDGLKGLERVIALDPDSADAWGRLCWSEAVNETDQATLKNCEKAVSLDQTASNFNGLGRAQEKVGDECAAEDSFTQASSKGSTGTAYVYVENMGRAALRCGKAYDARAGLEAALDLESKSLKDPEEDDDQTADDKQSQLADREYLIVTFDRLPDAKLAKRTCKDAHPDWKGCSCNLDAKGIVACVEAAK